MVSFLAERTRPEAAAAGVAGGGASNRAAHVPQMLAPMLLAYS